MLDLCGIGNACIDIAADVSDSFLRDWKFPKGICSHITADVANKLEQSLTQPQYIPGGCAANVASCIAALGGNAAFIGLTADDALGHLFADDLKRRNIRFTAKPEKSGTVGSTRVFALITPDRERTFAAYYGVQENLSPANLDPGVIRDSRFLYLDGYALNSRAGGETFLKAAAIARDAGRLVVLAPNDISVLTRYRDDIDRLMDVSHLFFCNDSEALYLTGQPTLDRALEILRGMVPAGAVTIGPGGAWIFDANGIRPIPASPPTGPVIDTNGAGDTFAGGCLFGLARGFSLEKSAGLGNLCAAAIITVRGPRPVTDYKSFLTLLG